MKIFYVGQKYDHYNPKRGLSFEHNNFYLSLENLPGTAVKYFPFDRILEIGRKKFNEEILEAVKEKEPDLVLFFMYSDELDKEILKALKRHTITLAWFADDYWRFFNYSKYWPSYFSYIVTTYSKAADWYRQAGYKNVILSQWACNDRVFRPLNIKKDIDVSFVGQYKSGRLKVIKTLKDSGINVECFGAGWPNGKVSREKMLEIFSRSRICLNLNDRKSLWDPTVIARLFLKPSINRIVPDFHFIDNIRSYIHFSILHTHARPFELSGCGAFVISGWSEDIGDYYKDGEEMIFYKDVKELVDKVKYYLLHGNEREKIARAAYARTIKEHTYEKRFGDIFRTIGLKS